MLQYTQVVKEVVAVLTVPKECCHIEQSKLGPHAGNGLFVRNAVLRKGACIWKKPPKFVTLNETTLGETVDDLLLAQSGDTTVGDVRCHPSVVQKLLAAEDVPAAVLFLLWYGYQPNRNGYIYMDGDEAVMMNCSTTAYNVVFKRDGNGYATTDIIATDDPIELIFHPKYVYCDTPVFTKEDGWLSVLHWFNKRKPGFFKNTVIRPSLHTIVTEANGAVVPESQYIWRNASLAS